MMNALTFYRRATTMASPLIRIYLKLRQLKGKEDGARMGERFGMASMARPAGVVWWLHAASVGEAVSLRPLIESIRSRAPQVHLLLTSGTVSSAAMLAESLPPGVIHQYVPIDTPKACARFLAHWQPQIGVFTESELWPNLIMQSHARGVKLALVNARMSAKSFRHWQVLDATARTLLGAFSLVAAQTAIDAQRYETLGAAHVRQLGHLKQDAGELPVDAATLVHWRAALEGRTMVVAASIHPGEDGLIAEMHARLKLSLPGLLTIVVPRHPPRAADMVGTFEKRGLKVRQRSESPTLAGGDDDIYIADTIGELGLWYRLADVVVMGGSFIAHGGQNPLEAIRLNKPVMVGPHMENFQTITDELLAVDGLKQLASDSVEEACQGVVDLLHADQSAQMVSAASDWLKQSPPVAQRLTEALLQLGGV